MLQIVTTNKLNEEQLFKLFELQEICRSFDNTKSSIGLAQELNFNKSMNSFFLCCEGETLVGFLSVFAPIKDEAEVSALVHPEYRRGGIFTKLLKRAAQELDKFGISEIYFVHDKLSGAGKAVVDKLGIEPDHSEYLLRYDKETGSQKTDVEIKLEEPGMLDLEDITALSIDVFGGNEEEWARLHSKCLKSRKIMCFTADCEGAKIGICSVNKTEQGLFLFGFGILPEKRRKGYGRAFLYDVVKILIREFDDDILLEVDSKNKGAYMLYTKSGFDKAVQFDYYKIRPEDVIKLQ